MHLYEDRVKKIIQTGKTKYINTLEKKSEKFTSSINQINIWYVDPYSAYLLN